VRQTMREVEAAEAIRRRELQMGTGRDRDLVNANARTFVDELANSLDAGDNRAATSHVHRMSRLPSVSQRSGATKAFTSYVDTVERAEAMEALKSR
jgi:hypothetical protein